MPQTLGELELKIVLEIVSANKNAKDFSATLKSVESQTKKTEKSAKDLSGTLKNVDSQSKKTGKSFVETGRDLTILGMGIETAGRLAVKTIGEFIRSGVELQNANLKLQATAKITGINFEFLKQASDRTRDSYKLTQIQSNELVIQLSKLGEKAGDVTKTEEAIKKLLDIGTAQGLTVEDTLYAIKQAILGIDEGTDKLFQKNPSVIYEEYAKQIGTTAGKLSDQQKAQALLNEVISTGEKVQGTYNQKLDTFAGKQQVFENTATAFKQAVGESMINSLNDLIKEFDITDVKIKSWFDDLANEAKKSIEATVKEIKFLIDAWQSLMNFINVMDNTSFWDKWRFLLGGVGGLGGGMRNPFSMSGMSGEVGRATNGQRNPFATTPVALTENAQRAMISGIDYQKLLNDSNSIYINVKNLFGLLNTGSSKFVNDMMSFFGVVDSVISGVTILKSIAGILGFASGGQVPGSGSGDTVPAMLTPGEFVINKTRASQLGSGFLQWMNGGGAVRSAPGMMGGGSLTIVANGKLTDALSFEVVDKGMRLRNVKITKSNY